MLEPRTIAEKSFNQEMHRIIGEGQLQRYGDFLNSHHGQLQLFKDKLSNVNNVRTMVVGLENDTFEDAPLLELVQSDNKMLSRIILSLSSLCEELKLLCKEASEEYYTDFTFYGEGTFHDNKGPPPVTKLMGKLQKLSFFVDRSQQVIVLLLRQICAILGKDLYVGSTGSHFPEPLNALGDLLVCLITLDTLCETILKDDWISYHKTVRSMLHNPSRLDVHFDDLRLLEKCISEIEHKVVGGNILQIILEKCVDDGLVMIMKKSSLNNEFSLHISQILTELEREQSINAGQLWVQVNAMFVLSYTCFGHLDKKMFKRLLDINKKIGGYSIIGNILWYAEKFLVNYIPVQAKSLDLKAALNNRLHILNARTFALPKEAHLLCTEAYAWIADILLAVNKDLSKLTVKQVQGFGDLLIDGIQTVKKISERIKWMTTVQADAGKPMGKSVLLLLCGLIEALKAVQCAFSNNIVQLVYIISLVCQHLTHKALTLLINIKKSFTQEKCYKEQQLDALSALNVAEHSLKGPNTRQRMLIASLAISASGLSYYSLLDVRTVINRLETICSVPSLIHEMCNCTFLYWYQVLLPVYFTKLMDSRQDLSRLYLLFGSLNDCVDVMGKSVEKSVETYFNKHVMLPLNQTVETSLRLQTHLHLQLPPTDPFQEPPINRFINLTPVPFSQKYIHIKEDVEHYLSATFYNLTTVILHDWRIYGEMRKLGVLQYGLSTVDDCLPTQTLEQGIDVLEIMRNIHVFVGKYLYNLNNQVFIEEKSNNKHLNTIGISHVANSIRTHGIGIMNTTVNFTYQFLQNQFFIFSQFMYDEQIKSRLLKDIRFFIDNRIELNQTYPYERAEKFNIGIRKLGLNPEGLSFLDLFRRLITHIGNAMGYIRMVRSGGRRCLSDANSFLPDIKSFDQLKKLLEVNTLSASTKKAIDCFAHDVDNMVENFQEATEYFKLLINVFKPVFRDPQNVHLKNFYIIIPPLTINFIEHIFICKDKLTKKNKDGAGFTDDGFAMGLAYIVELLDQNDQLLALQWFNSIRIKHAKERADLERQKVTASREDIKLQQTLALTEKRLHSFEKEFKLFFYNFNSARIFFQP